MEPGRILKIDGHRLLTQGPHCRIGDLVVARTTDGRLVRCLVEGFNGVHIHLLAMDEIYGLGYGSLVFSTGRPISLNAGPFLKGRILDGFGYAPQQEGAIGLGCSYPTMQPKRLQHLPMALDRKFHTGVRSIDTLLPLAVGQRVLVQSLCPNSSLLRRTTSMMARHGRASTVVFGLIGFRQRSVSDLVQLLEPGALDRSIVFSAPSEASPGERFHCAYAAMTAAEYFRDQGEDVLLVLDSLQSWQDAYCALSPLGNQHARTMLQGATLAQLLERAGRREQGSITGLFCLEGLGGGLSREVGELSEGRILFTSEMESLGVYPPIDVLNSHSDPATNLISLEQQQLISGFQGVLRYYQKNQRLIRMGALFEGLSADGDRALDTVQRCWGFLRQGLNEPTDEKENLRRLARCVGH